jgi:hypothetical protein
MRQDSVEPVLAGGSRGGAEVLPKSSGSETADVSHYVRQGLVEKPIVAAARVSSHDSNSHAGY